MWDALLGAATGKMQVPPLCQQLFRSLNRPAGACAAVNRRMDEWVKMENLDLTTVDISDSEGSDGRGCVHLAPTALPMPWQGPCRNPGCNDRQSQCSCRMNTKPKSLG